MKQSDRNKRRRIAFAVAGARAPITRRGINAWKNPHAEHAPLSRLFVKSNGQSQSGDFSRLFSAHSFFFATRERRN